MGLPVFIGSLIAAVIVTGFIARAWNIVAAIVFCALSFATIFVIPFGSLGSLVVSMVMFPIAQRRKMARIMEQDDSEPAQSVD